ncbi:MAG: undecaprenyldiphospho-muramoylpentapeptide beta-N-acetylglucosaminyltransferase [Thermodesulfobacteriota bacterium]
MIAGGGTGGHLFPALALAEEFTRRDRTTEITFIGGRGGLEEKVVPGYGYELEVLRVEAIKKRRGLGLVKALYRAVGATVSSLGLLRKIRPDGVIGSGSYASGPVVLAAKLMGIKTAILEQNAVPGLTNKLLGRFVDRVYIAFEDVAAYFPAARVVMAGNPVRRDIIEARAGEVRKSNGKLNIFVFGGSQGATPINAAFLDATEYLTDIWSSLRVVHQTGYEGLGAAKAAYSRKGLKVELHSFIENMAETYASSDLVVCRAGATSIAEITALGLPAILVPYPFATDGHQEVNARCLADSGAAVMIRQDELTGSTLARVIRGFFEDRRELKRMREEVKGLGRPGAAATIADDYVKVLAGEERG